MQSSLPFAGLIRYLKYKFLGRDIIISGTCRQCGSCCRRLSLDINGSWLRSATAFKKLAQDNPNYERFIIIGRDENGYLEFTCTWLKEDSTCRDYENRLKICRKFPEKNLFFMNGVLPNGCGYRMQQGTPFEQILERAMKGKRTTHFPR